MKILIVGAGVAGAVLARRLERLPNVDVVCLEKVGQDDHSHSGTGLNIGPNAMKLLRQHEPQLAETLENASLPWTRWRTELTDGTLLSDLPLAEVADCPGVRIRWSELYRVLREGVSAIRYDCTIDEITAIEGSQKLRARWRQGEHLFEMDDIDLLVGADGRYSRTRKQFSGSPESSHLGIVIVRALVQDTSDGLIDDFVQYFNGPHRLLAFRVSPGNVYITATRPTIPGAEIEPSWKTADAIRAWFKPERGSLSAEVHWLLDALCSNLEESHWARMQEASVRLAEPEVNVMYLGDSAHAMVPTLGQGATQALEGACVASAIFEQLLSGTELSSRELIRAVEVARSQRVRFVMDLSRRASDALLLGADPVKAATWKTHRAYLNDLSELYLLEGN